MSRITVLELDIPTGSESVGGRKPADYLILHDEVVMPASKKKAYRYWKRKNAWRKFFTVLLFILSTVLCAGVMAFFYKLWKYNFAGDADWVDFLGKFKFLKFEEYGNLICRSIIYLFILNLCNYIGCFAFRYGKINIPFWLIYAAAYLACFYLFWDWNVRNYCSGDMKAWIEMITSLKLPAIIYALGVVYGILSTIAFYRARFSGNFDDGVEGRLSPHVFFTFIILMVTNVGFIAIAALWLIGKLISAAAKKSALNYVESLDY